MISDHVEAPARSGARPEPVPRWLPDLVGILWTVAAGIAVVIPALLHGSHLGPFDLLSRFGLSKLSGVVIHNTYTGDQISAIMPWNALAWTQVHQGHLPLWNPYNGLGMPLAFNWQSAPFGLPTLVGYLVPLQDAYTVGIIVSVIVAGTGAYFLARVLQIGVLGCTMAGTVFELSGPFMQWLGWPHAAVFSWAGWMFAAALLIVRGKHRIRDVAFFAVVFAFAVYAGQPEILVLLIFALGVFLAALLIQLAWKDGIQSLLRPIVALAIATAVGGALSAPLLLPGLQLASGSVHSKSTATLPLPAHALPYLVMQGFDGLPIAGSRMFGPFGPFYVGGYVGIIALVLAVVAVAVRRRPPEVIALAALALVAGGIAFAAFNSHLISLLQAFPIVGTMPSRCLLPLALAVAVLAGKGLDSLVRADRAKLWRRTAAGFAAAGALLLLLFPATVGVLSGVDNQLRERSFIWPILDVIAGLAATGGLALWSRRWSVEYSVGAIRPVEGDLVGSPDHDTAPPPSAEHEATTETAASPRRLRIGPSTWAGIVLLAAQTAFLVTAGAPLWSSSSSFYAPTRAEATLQRTVQSSLVAMGATTFGCGQLGILPSVNDVYGIHELSIYDPMVPSKYFTSFAAITGRAAGYPALNSYCPSLTTVSLARLYGASYLLEPSQQPGPDGTKFVVALGTEDLYRVPDSLSATLTPLRDGGTIPAASGPGTPVYVTHPSPASWKLTTSANVPEALRLRLADIPGWQASIDGRPLALGPFSGIMLEARIPSGRHTIELRYWPDTFTTGLVLAAAAAIGITMAGIFAMLHRRRRMPAADVPASAPVWCLDD